ncbi:MAG: SDR family oxidoreductase [Chloroflexi bacterium]|nr:SDR family oxidoreductase [Chloroflexota bacterium]
MLKEYSLKDKSAIVTGAGHGLGKAIILAFAESGADVVAVARTASEIEETAAEVRKMGRKAVAIPTDVTKEAQVEDMAKRAVGEFGKIDILVNNVGWAYLKPLLPTPGMRTPDPNEKAPTRISLEEWYRHIDINLTSVFLCCRAVGPHMLAAKKGKIINITSGEGIKATPYMLPYSSAKAGVAMFSRCLALEWGRYGINVNAIAPGLYRTPLMETAMDDKQVDRVVSGLPIRRLGDPREVALAAVYLASDASNFVTGHVLPVDGGGTAR